eukprot:710143-Pelagomonas_calceolata.AAC.6
MKHFLNYRTFALGTSHIGGLTSSAAMVKGTQQDKAHIFAVLALLWALHTSVVLLAVLSVQATKRHKAPILVAAVLLRGLCRSVISLVVLMVEGTQGIEFLPGIILAVVVANWVAHYIHHDGA